MAQPEPKEQGAVAEQQDFPDIVAKRDALNREYNQFLVCGSLFECPAKYLPIKPIGKGAYGVVCSAKNLECGNDKVAIKKITNAFDNVIDAKRTLREIKLLRHLAHENIIQVKDVIPPMSRLAFKDVYVVYELMDTDLHQIIRSPQPLSDDHCQYFTYQVLRGLKYIHSANILHRDLKPSNLLVNANCDLKICDFGLARTKSSSGKEFMTEYVVTRWYRAPELLLSCSEYTASIDVWSVGCIFAELLGRKPLFPGKDYVHQLNLITKIIGSPDENELGFITSEKAKRYIRSLPRNERVDFQKLWPHANRLAIDLIDKMLVFDPSKRITVEQALEHPYLASLHDLSDEPVCTHPFDFDFDADGLTPDVVREIISRDSLCSVGHMLLDHEASMTNGASSGGAGDGAPLGSSTAGSQPAGMGMGMAPQPGSASLCGTGSGGGAYIPSASGPMPGSAATQLSHQNSSKSSLGMM